MSEPLFAFERLNLTRRDGVLWIEGTKTPLGRETARMLDCFLRNEDEEGQLIAYGSSEYLETCDAPLRVVTEAWA